MSGFEIWGLALGLAMDGFAVSVASGIHLQRVRWKPILLMALSFVFFQIFNPLLGWFGTFHFRGAGRQCRAFHRFWHSGFSGCPYAA